jgi:hypothetical protein
MSVTAKRLLAIFLLVVFLMPSTGLMLYAHKCNMNNSTVFNTEEMEHCCSHSEFTPDQHHHQFDITNDTTNELASSLSALPCCEDSSMLVKIGDEFVNQNISNFISLLPILILSNATYMPVDHLLTGNVILFDYIDYHPKLPSYLKNESLRL